MEDFVAKIIKADRYEWLNRSAETKPAKEIFLRDIWLSWYVLGVNSTINSIDKLIHYLRKEAEGYEVVTVGVSSGGYLAAILAEKLSAKRCFDFSGQFSLEHHFDHVQTNPFLSAYKANNHGTEEYLEAWRLLQDGKCPIYYFCPAKCEQDITQAGYAYHCRSVKCIPFNSNRHGSPVFSICLPRVLAMEQNELDNIVAKSKIHNLNPIMFSIRVSGLRQTVVFLGRKLFKRYVFNKS